MSDYKPPTLAELVAGWCDEVDRFGYHLRNKDKGGMRVPYHGDFAGCPPSTLSRMEWWAREFRNARTAPVEASPEPSNPTPSTEGGKP